jgi:UDP-N-acetylglucosamine 2-epimerase (non-hydrolysing)
MKILNVVGARPNFVKIAPLLRVMRTCTAIDPILVHTGQHYDAVMSDQFFVELALPAPDFSLGVGSGTHATQTADVMRRLEPILVSTRPDLVLVVGDVNSTLAAALAAAKLAIRVAHVEAGLRSFDRAMPEEINRVVTDALADLLFVTEEGGRTNLLREGVEPAKIHFVGNVMIDALRASRRGWEASSIREQLGLPVDRPYALMTLHRPSNVDDPAVLSDLLDAVHELARQLPVVFPLHPRVRAQLQTQREELADASELAGGKGIAFVDALGYLDFVALMSRAALVLTDSGGVQEETTALGVPCLTLRTSTERPITVSHGTNRVIGIDPRRIVDEALSALNHPPRPLAPPPLWDGRAAQRIIDILVAQNKP